MILCFFNKNDSQISIVFNSVSRCSCSFKFNLNKMQNKTQKAKQTMSLQVIERHIYIPQGEYYELIQSLNVNLNEFFF